MLNIAVCEDCQSHAEIILSMLDSYRHHRPDIEILAHPFCSGNELSAILDTGKTFNFFLLDILMPGISGIELAAKIRAQDADVPLAFITSSPDYALDAFKVSAVQYLLKPVSKESLYSILDKISITSKQEKEQMYILSTAEKLVQIPLSSIICVELAGRSLRVCLENGVVLYSKSIRKSFAEAVAPLLNDNRFLYSHKSFVLNMTHANEFNGESFLMKNDICVPVSRSKYAETKAKYISYLSGTGIGQIGC